MPYDTVNRLEKLYFDLIKDNIKEVNQKDMERLIIKYTRSKNEKTIKRDIEVMIIMKWIKETWNVEEKQFYFKILENDNSEELF